METTEVVHVKGSDGKPLRINKSDHDPKVHGEIIGGDEPAQSEPALTPSPFNPSAPSQTTVPATVPAPSNPSALPPNNFGVQGVIPAPSATAPGENIVNPVPGQPLPSLVPPDGTTVAPTGTPAPLAPVPPSGEPAKSAAPADKFAAMIGDKWFIIDRSGNKVMDKAFKDQAAAEKAIVA